MYWHLKHARSSNDLCPLPKSNGREFMSGRTSWSNFTYSILIIYLSSGDTGVSAALVLRGTPPFQVYYRSQRDNETPRDASKTFPTSRGELTLQPESSGHYTFTFVQISDAHYKKVELSGPSIDQVIHPLAAADFAGGRSGKKRSVSSCEGNTIDIDVDLKVSTCVCGRMAI